MRSGFRGAERLHVEPRSPERSELQAACGSSVSPEDWWLRLLASEVRAHCLKL